MSWSSTILATTAALLLALAGCGGKKAAPAAGDDGGATAATSGAASGDGGAATTAGASGDAGAATPATPAAPDPAVARVRAETEAFLKRWVDAQNQHDFAGYSAMYQPKHFRGVKRVHGKGARNFDHAGWLKDRKRMVLGNATVVAELESIETWLDPGSKLKPDVASIRFTQRWKGGGYADHGIKILQVWQAPDKTWRIVYEDLLNSEPGWGTPPTGVAPIDLAAAKDDAEALAQWQRLAPNGATYEQVLASIPDDDAVRRPLARALLTAGSFACKQTVDAGYCGEEILEWAPLSADNGLDDPCLRRRLAEWALDALDDADVAALMPVLETLVALDEPEVELAAGAFDVLPASADDLRLTLLAAALENDRETLAEEQVAGLVSDAARVKAATELHLDAAVALLDPDRHRGHRVAALTDDKLLDATRATLVESLSSDKGTDVTTALQSVVDDASCGLAMLAAEALAERGDRSRLPRHPRSSVIDEYRAELCMLAHAGADADPDARWQELLAAKVTVSEEHSGDWEEDTESSEEMKRADIALPTETLGDSGTCAGMACTWTEGNDTLEITFEATDKGELRIVELKTTTWSGCGC